MMSTGAFTYILPYLRNKRNNDTPEKQSAIIASFSMSVDKILEYTDPELKEFNINLGDNLNKR